MHRQRLPFWSSLALIAMLILAGCAPRAGQGLTAQMADQSDLVVDLPAIVIDFNDAGEPSVGNVPVAQLAATFGAAGLDQLKIDANTLGMLTKANIQHIQIDNQPTGLEILVNGQAIPSIGWDGETLSATPATLTLLGGAIPATLESVLPMITNLGIGAILRFPVTAGAEAIPTYITGEGSAAAKATAAQDAFMASVGTPPKINVPIFYDADGSFRIADLTEAEFTTLTGMPMTPLHMQPNVIADFQQKGVKDITLSTDADGVHLTINGSPLPYISWADGKLNHLLDLAGQMGLWDTLADQGMNVGQITATVDQVLPMVMSTDFDIHLFFPS